jgi:hypothetical protein
MTRGQIEQMEEDAFNAYADRLYRVEFIDDQKYAEGDRFRFDYALMLFRTNAPIL